MTASSNSACGVSRPHYVEGKDRVQTASVRGNHLNRSEKKEVPSEMAPEGAVSEGGDGVPAEAKGTAATGEDAKVAAEGGTETATVTEVVRGPRLRPVASGSPPTELRAGPGRNGGRGPGQGGPRQAALRSQREAAAAAEAASAATVEAPAPVVVPAPAPEAETRPAPGPGKGQGREPPPVVQIRPIAEQAHFRRRHWGLLASFVLAVVLPVVVTALYLWLAAVDQYASTVGFTVRREGGADAAQLLGGLAQLTGSGGSSEADILYEFIQSQEIVEAVNKRIDLTKMYSAAWPKDPVFALWPDASVESLLWYWKRVVRISYDQNTGLIELRVLGFSPDQAQQVASAIVAESQQMINDLNATARQDLMRYSTEDLEKAVDRLKKAREALTQFRTETKIVDPEADIAGRMGVLNNLQQQLAQALVDHDLLLSSAKPNDPRLLQAQSRIDVIKDRIIAERQNLSSSSEDDGGLPEDYPRLISEFESLSVDRQYAEETYRAALAAVDLARAGASRQTLYLAAFVRPTLPETSEFPRRWVLVTLVALFLTMAWGVLSLVYYSLRDRH